MNETLSLTVAERSSLSGQTAPSEEAEVLAGCRAGDPAALVDRRLDDDHALE